jgi:hypothetical protein
MFRYNSFGGFKGGYGCRDDFYWVGFVKFKPKGYIDV